MQLKSFNKLFLLKLFITPISINSSNGTNKLWYLRRFAREWNQ